MIFTYWAGDPSANPALQAAAAEWRERWGHFTIFGDADVLPLLKARGGDGLVDLYNRITIPACRSDVARLVLLLEHGGLYVDAHTGIGDPTALARVFEQLSTREAVVFDVTWLHGHANDMHICNTVLCARKNASFVEQVFHEAVTNLYAQAHKEAHATAFEPYNIFVLTGAIVISRHLMVTTPAGKFFNPEFRDRVHHQLLVEGEQSPVQLYRHYGYRAPGMHWSERQMHEPLFAPAKPSARRRAPRRKAPPAPTWALLEAASGGVEVALDRVEALSPLRESRFGGVVVALASGEEATAEAAERADALGVHLVSGDEPPEVLGLLACPDEFLVLKVRPDAPALDAAHLDWATGRRMTAYEERATPKSFVRPVHVTSGMLLEPLRLDDRIAFGQREDLLRVARAAAQDEGAPHLAAHAQKFPSLSLYQRLTRPLGPTIPRLDLLQTDLAMRVLAISARLIVEDYLLGDTPEAEAYGEARFQACRQVRFGDVLRGAATAPGVIASSGDGVIRFEAGTWAVAAREGWFKPDETLERFRAAYAAIREGDRLSDNPVFPPAEAVAFAEALQRLRPEYQPTIALEPAEAAVKRAPAGPTVLKPAGVGRVVRSGLARLRR